MESLLTEETGPDSVLVEGILIQQGLLLGFLKSTQTKRTPSVEKTLRESIVVKVCQFYHEEWDLRPINVYEDGKSVTKL